MGTPASSGLAVNPTKVNAPSIPKASVVIDQADMYTNIFSRYSDHSKDVENGGIK